jgi:hypothetical protein
MSIKVPLIDALLGFERKVTLLNGSNVWIASPPGRTTGHDDTFVLEGLGMPIPDDPMRSHGDLYIHIEVGMPQQLQLSSEDRQSLQRIIGVSSAATGKASVSFTTGSDTLSSNRQVMKPTNIRNLGRRHGVFGTQQQHPRFRSNNDGGDGGDDGDDDDDNDDHDDDVNGFSSFSSFFR